MKTGNIIGLLTLLAACGTLFYLWKQNQTPAAAPATTVTAAPAAPAASPGPTVQDTPPSTAGGPTDKTAP